MKKSFILLDCWDDGETPTIVGTYDNMRQASDALSERVDEMLEVYDMQNIEIVHDEPDEVRLVVHDVGLGINLHVLPLP